MSNSKTNLKQKGHRNSRSNNVKRRESAKGSVKNTSKGEQTIDNGTGMKKTKRYDDIKTNDISWYNKAAYLFDEAVRVPFDAIAGAPRSYANTPNGSDNRAHTISPDSPTGVDVDGIAAPGIMVINYHPTVGYADGVNSPINRAFTTMYGDIASKTTGAMQFQQADLAFFNTSLAATAAVIGAAKRCLEVATLYSPLNYYYPVDLLTAMLGSQEYAMDVISNRDLYRARINDLIYQFNSLKIPAFISIYERQYSIAHNVYADEDSVQAQLYVFKPLGYYIYDDTTTTMKYSTLAYEGISSLIYAAQAAMSAWRNSSAFPLISGALQRAYPDNAFIVLDMLTVDSVNVPVYDRNILWQINNSRCVRVLPESLDITQDVVKDFLSCKPRVALENNVQKTDFWRSWVYLNSYDHNESPEFVMEATRLVPALYAESSDDADSGIIRTGSTELIANWDLFFRVRDVDGVEHLQSAHGGTNMSLNVIDIQTLGHLSKWHNAPFVDVWDLSDTDNIKFIATFGDLKHYTYLYDNQLQSLHEASLQSLFWIGSMSVRTQ